MHKRSAVGVLGFVAAALLAPSAAADTCCANRDVEFHPARADRGDTVTVDGIACLQPDNSGPLALNLVSFWLATTDVPASSDPDTTPGEAIGPQTDDVPPVEDWLPFASVSGEGLAAAGSAAIIVPRLRAGTYQLWWLCDNGGGPGSGVHYSGGPRLTVGLPDSATAPAVAPAAPRPISFPVIPILLLLAGAVAGMATLRRLAHR